MHTVISKEIIIITMQNTSLCNINDLLIKHLCRLLTNYHYYGTLSLCHP